MRRIALVNSLYSPIAHGGAEVSLEELAKLMASRGFRVYVLCLSRERKSRVYRRSGVIIISLRLWNIYWPFASSRSRLMRAFWHVIDKLNLAMAIRVVAIAYKLKVEALQLHNTAGFSPWIPLLMRGHGVDVYHYIHDYAQVCSATTMYSKGAICTRACVACRIFSVPGRMAAFNVQRWFFNSNFVFRRLKEEGIPISVANAHICYGIVSRVATETPTAGNNVLVVGYIGRIVPTKGVEVLCEAIQRLRRSDVCLKVAGSYHNEFASRLRAQYGSDNVQFLGHVNPPEFFHAIDILVVPSLWDEPMGRVVVEANAFGVPAIVFRNGGLPEMIQEGVTGFAIDPTVGALGRVLEGIDKQEVKAMYSDCIAYAQRFHPHMWWEVYGRPGWSVERRVL